MKNIIYYTDNRLGDPIYSKVQSILSNMGLPIVSASLEPIDFGENEVVDGERGYPTLVKQIISCLERSKGEYVFFCEHDVLYHPSHFDFIPPRDDIFYYNENVWRWQIGSDRIVTHDRMIPLSCMCADKDLALNHYRLRAEAIKKNGWDKIKSKEPKWVRRIGYEPGTKKRKRGGLTDDNFETWESAYPNIDIRHDKTFSSPKTSIDSFIHKPKWWMDCHVSQILGWDLEKVF